MCNVLTVSEVTKVCLKGKVHLKIKLLSLFTHPDAIPNPYDLFLLCNIKRLIFAQTTWTSL